MPTPEELKNQARIKAREILAESESFRNLSQEQQFEFYKDLVNKTYQELVRQNEPAQAMSTSTLDRSTQTQPTALARQAGLATALSNSNPENIQKAGDNFANLVDKVDFPGFVRDLLNGVFNANLEANERQMEAYQRLLKEATKGVDEFAKDVTNMDALMRMVETSGGYSLGPPNPLAAMGADADAGAAEMPTLLDLKGKPVDMNNSAIQGKLIEAKLALAKEKRTMLRETILMGVSRLVVEKGIIRAEVEFQIDAKATTEAATDDTKKKDTTASLNASGGGGVGPWKVSASTNLSRTSSQVSISTSKDTTSTDASAKLKGFVEIQFKSDYFKLDNFASMFDLGQGRTDPVAANAQQNQASATTPAS